MSGLTLGQIVIDCEQPAALASFYASLLDRPVEDSNEFYAFLPGSADGTFPSLMFLKVPEPRTSKNRLHLDLFSTDHPSAVERAVSLGATRHGDFSEFGTTWTTLADPEGNVFDIGAAH